MELKPSVTPATVDVVPPEMWPEFGTIALPVAICARERVGEGVRWCLWPLCFEVYTGDIEPDLKISRQGRLAYNRIILWKRINRTDTPQGWHSPRNKLPWRKDGVVLLDGSDYHRHWSKDAVRNLRTWQKKYLNITHDIIELSFEEFKKTYKKSLTRKRAGPDILQTFERQMSLPEVRNNVVLWGVRNKSTRNIIAGTAVLYSPEHKSSMRICPFMSEEARSTDAMIGLIDHWFSESQRRGFRTQFFTYFWQKGEPKEWKGFSTYKSHFIQYYLSYPPLLWRPVRGKFF